MSSEVVEVSDEFGVAGGWAGGAGGGLREGWVSFRSVAGGGAGSEGRSLDFFSGVSGVEDPGEGSREEESGLEERRDSDNARKKAPKRRASSSAS